MSKALADHCSWSLPVEYRGTLIKEKVDAGNARLSYC